MSRPKKPFKTKSFSVTVTEDLLEIFEKYINALQMERGVVISKNSQFNEALREFLKNKNPVQKK